MKWNKILLVKLGQIEDQGRLVANSEATDLLTVKEWELELNDDESGEGGD